MVLKLPDQGTRAPTAAATDTRETRLGREVASRTPETSGLSGIRILRQGKDAFAARSSLARLADRTIDVQYYIWHDDLSGSLLFDELQAAADRGVRVRILLDDLGIARIDARLACLDRHERIEVRLYNPCLVRKPKAINLLFDFQRLNRRMHSKSFTVDNQATILGGRNIGDEYFGARKDGLFADLDVLAVGAVVPEVSRAFDQYWNSSDSYAASDILKPVSARKRRQVAAKARNLANSDKAKEFLEAVAARPLMEHIETGTVQLHWVPARLADHTYWQGESCNPEQLCLSDLLPADLSEPERELDLISAYFVPTRTGADQLAELARSGVAVRVLTNCFAATDVGFVHTGYVPYRKQLLAAGVRLFELPAPDDKPKTARKFVRSGSLGRLFLPEGSRTLHAKAIVVDGRELYIGSANFDPRSACLNTEMGLIVESPGLAAEMSRLFEIEIEPGTYSLGFEQGRGIYWIDARDDKATREYVEPHTGPITRTLIRLLSRLPIERLL